MARYIEFSKDNLNVYSIELAHLLLSSASEIDTLAKCVCTILEPKAKPRNIDQYRKIIRNAEENESGFGMHVLSDNLKQRLSGMIVHIPRYNLTMTPWKPWADDKNPPWWRSYNNVKHERNQYFNEATLKNVLNSMAALLCINYLYCRLSLTNGKPENWVEFLSA